MHLRPIYFYTLDDKQKSYYYIPIEDTQQQFRGGSMKWGIKFGKRDILISLVGLFLSLWFISSLNAPTLGTRQVNRSESFLLRVSVPR